MKAYHFTNGNKLRDGRSLPAIGEWLEHEGPLVPCAQGLHASEHPMDALKYAPGCLLHLVELGGEMVSHEMDKWCARRRKVLATIDAEPLLREFARWCALRVIHLWDYPLIVRQYLETGNESIRATAEHLTWGEARNAARGAAWDASRDAARGAAWDASRDAARGAARDAARDAAWDAAWAAANDAAWDSAGHAVRDAAWDAARDAARAAQREKFNTMVEAAFAASEKGNQ
jgi:hypothetical protein